jgi:SAM-dependent methyltransferase
MLKRHLPARLDHTGTDVRERVRLLNDPNLERIAEAWEVAARSSASAPGVRTAYYSLDIEGVHFPGERPWLLRWNRLRSAVSFEGKRFLELGSNMALLSIHAKLVGAAACRAVDVDTDILCAATLAAEGFGVDLETQVVDLDDPRDWERGLDGFDIVAALSVMHWIRDKARVWRFIATHREVLYEGHEVDDEAEKQLRLAGFDVVTRLGVTERNRQLFYGRRQLPASPLQLG